MKKYARLFVCAALLMLLLPASCFATLSFFNGGYSASPSPAKAGDTVSIMFVEYDSYYIAPSVTVTVNGHSTANLQHTGPYGPCTYFTCSYTVLGSGQDPDGAASIEIYATDSMNQSNDYIATSWLLLDSTNPTTPTVTDDGTYTSSASLHASWTASSATSGVAQYQYAIGTTSGGTDVVGWTSAGTSTSVTTGSLSLTSGQTYYISVKAQSNVGLWSSVGTSDGIMFDNTTPTTPAVTDGGASTTSTTQLNVSWTASSAPSGIAEYQYTIGTNPTDIGCGYIIPWTSTGTQTQATVSNLQLHSGWTYYLYVKARSAAGNWSTVGLSDGIEAGVQLVAKDYLAGIGDFAWSPETRWSSAYTGNDFVPQRDLPYYEWAQQVSGIWNGFDSPGTHDTIAIGWYRYTNGAINPATMLECDLVDASTKWSGETGKCQYLAVMGIPTTGWAQASVIAENGVPVNNADANLLHTGDQITFTLDKVYIDGVTDLPPGAWVSFVMTFGVGTTSYTIPYTATSASVTYTIPSGASGVLPALYIATGGGLDNNKPAIYFKGAHITAVRGGNQVGIESQLPQRRTIKTSFVHYAGAQDPAYMGANFDWIQLDGIPLCNEQQLRKINPNIKLYLYEPSNFKDCRSGGVDQWHATAIPFGWVLANHTDWLYSNGQGGYFTNPDFAKEYYAQFSNSDLQTAWANSVASVLEQYHLDGLWIDTLIPVTSPITRDGGECQSFVHGVVPTLRSVTWTGEQTARRMDIIHNTCYCNINNNSTDFGSAMLNPVWTGASPYTDNSITPDLPTPDGHYAESCFYYYYFNGGVNSYSSSYWQSCLTDMDTVSSWNASLSSDNCKWIHCQANGVDRSDGHATGVDGWINFALCSYLLGQNSWTTFGVTNQFTPNYDTTMDYPTPAGARYQIGSTSNFVARDYYGDDGGARGGTVVVNGNSVSHDYTPQVDLIEVTDSGNVYVPCGTSITINANKGRMFFNPSSYKYVSAITSPAQNQVISGSTYTVQGCVKKNRANQSYPSDVQIRIDGGSWIDCSVDSQTGAFSYSWTGISAGTHTISSRVYVSSSDYEPEKPARTFSK